MDKIWNKQYWKPQQSSTKNNTSTTTWQITTTKKLTDAYRFVYIKSASRKSNYFIEWKFTSYNNQHLHTANLRWLQKPYAIISLTNETNEKKNPTRSNCFTDNNSFSKLVIFRNNTNRNIIGINTMISHYQPENTYYVIRHVSCVWIKYHKRFGNIWC